MKKIFKKMNKSFISGMDTFLQNFDKSNSSSTSQHKEVKKHQDIAKKRDQVQNPSTTKTHWPQD